MGKDISFKNHDRFIHLGIAIAALRKMRGMSQEQLAEKAGISRSLISAIEAPGLAKSFSLDVFLTLLTRLILILPSFFQKERPVGSHIIIGLFAQ